MLKNAFSVASLLSLLAAPAFAGGAGLAHDEIYPEVYEGAAPELRQSAIAYLPAFAPRKEDANVIMIVARDEDGSGEHEQLSAVWDEAMWAARNIRFPSAEVGRKGFVPVEEGEAPRGFKSIRLAFETGECPAWASWASACHEELSESERKYILLVDDEFDSSAWRTQAGIAMRLNDATVVDLSYRSFDSGGLDKYSVTGDTHGRFDAESVMLNLRLPFGE